MRERTLASHFENYEAYFFINCEVILEYIVNFAQQRIFIFELVDFTDRQNELLLKKKNTTLIKKHLTDLYIKHKNKR